MFQRYRLLEDSDSYKNSFPGQYALDTTGLFLYLAARKSSIPGIEYTVFMGLQPILKQYLNTQITMQDIDEAEVIFKAHMGCFPRAMWEHIVNCYNGYIPVTIKAVPEGMKIPIGHALLTVECVDKVAYPIATYIEDIIHRVWYPTTVCTISNFARGLIYEALQVSSMDPDNQIGFKLHDFGARGVSSYESAKIGGSAHLVNFKGSDTVPALRFIMDYYNYTGMPGFSISAMEHSTITSWGKVDEFKGYLNFVKHIVPKGGMGAAVSDSYDIDNAVLEGWNKNPLKQAVIDSGATIVVRPDSDKDPAEGTVRCLDNLLKGWGADQNDKGYLVLRVMREIYGDGINIHTIPNVLKATLAAGWSIDNIAMGMGGGLLQKVDRDTFGFGYKASARQRNYNDWIDIYKQPKGSETKKSRGGRISLYQNKAGEFRTEKIGSLDPLEWTEILVPVFKNGEVLVDHKWEDVCSRAIS